MSTIDERVVGMRFDNSKFAPGLKSTLDGLDKLKQSLKMDGAVKGIDELDAAGKRFNLVNVSGAVEGVSGKFLALATIGITALSNIVNKAVDAGQRIVSSLTVDPIKAGLDEYELKMGSIQTILANTARYGTSLGEVTSSLEELNKYADKTIYNFGDMTKNIGLFTNAGLRIEEATSLIKGFSNEAAASGTNAQGAAGAAYQLSQALSAGTIRLMDWRSLQNVGMGNKNMQNGLIEIAEAMGTFSNGTATAQSASENFNGSLEQNWLSAEVMSNYLKIMAGDMDSTAQAALGLSDATIESFSKQQKMSEEAATKVRTFTQLMGTLQESVGSSWSESFDIIIGDFETATDLFTNVNNTLGDMIGEVGATRNRILQEWSDNGGRAAAIEAIASAFSLLMRIMRPVKAAFEDVFPPLTGKTIADITINIRDFIQSLKPGTQLMSDIQSTARGFFSAISIGIQIISGFGRVIAEALGFAAQGGGSLLSFTAGIGDWITKVDQAMKKGEGLSKFFTGLSSVLKVVLGVLGAVVGGIGDFIASAGEIATSGLDGFFERIQERFAPLSNMFSAIFAIMQRVGEVAKSVFGFFEPFIRTIGNLAKGLGSAIADSFSNGNMSTALDAVNTGLLAGIGVLIYKFIEKLKGTLGKLDPGAGLIDTIKGVFGEVTNTLTAMQGQLKAKTLLTIAGAIALLTVSVIALSLIDTAKLFIALGAITVMFTQLGLAMAGFEKLFTLADATKLTVLSVALIGLGTAMLIFAGAVAILGNMSPAELATGLVGLGGALAIVSGAMLLLSKTGPGAILGSAALVIASAGMILLAGALKILATLSWDDIGRGMVALGGSLAILAVGLTLMTASIPGAAALVIASVGILVIAGALKIFSTLSWDDIGRAMATLGSTLAILAVGLTLMTASIPGAAALVIASVGITIIAAALKIFSTLSWDDIGRAMTLLGGTLAILAVGLTLMIASLPGAAALLVAAAALAIIAPVLAFLGTLTWEQIGTGLGALALSLGLLAVAGYALIPAVPGLVGLGLAIALLGVGVLAAGVGVSALAIGLTALATAGGAAIVVLTAAVSALAGLIPYIAQQIGLGLIEIANVIAVSGPAILAALSTILLALIQAIVEIIPPLVDAAVLLVTKLVEAIVILIPMLVDAGMKLIIGILDGVANNIGKVIEKGTDVIVKFIEGIGKAIPRLLQAAADFIIDFLNGIATAIRNNTAKINKAGANIADAIIEGITGGLSEGISKVVKAAKKLADDALSAAKKALGIKSPSRKFKEVGKFSAEGLAGGIIENSKLSERAAGTLGDNTIVALKKSMSNAGMFLSLSGMDVDPTIRPVLDLSAVKRDAGLIGGIVGKQSLSVDASTARANEISARYGEYQQAMADNAGPTTEVNLTQYNYSPKALPQSEIYRQGKNQMSILKAELEKDAAAS